jgi:DNA-binding protein HU-beta
MTKPDLVASLSKISGFSQATSLKALDATMSSITKALKDGNEVRLPGFGTFRAYHRSASEGRNPRTGKAIKIPAKKLPKFKASPQLKAAIS